jgi:uncharacterized protein (TIGR03382 family)
VTRTPLAFALLLLSPAALAEGSAELPGQWMLASTTAYVDVVNASAETITFSIQGRVTVYSSSGGNMGSYGDGDTFDPLENGPHRLVFSQDQRVDWDVQVNGAPAGEGRLWSLQWELDGRDYDADQGFDGGFFGLVDGGDGQTGVVQVRVNGWAGNRWTAIASPAGFDGDHNRSLPTYLAAYTPSVPLYLNPPSVADYAHSEPTVSGLAFTIDPNGGGTFTFELGQSSTWHLVCDRDEDGVLDPTNEADFVITGYAAAGPVEVVWDGDDRDGFEVIRIDACEVRAATGELHFLAEDIETAWPGMQAFAVGSSGAATPLAMFWNDTPVIELDVPTPDGTEPAFSSGPSGLMSGDAGAAMSGHVNSRAWGDFSDQSRGNAAVLDTWARLALSAPSSADIGYDLDPDEVYDDPTPSDTDLGYDREDYDGYTGGYYMGGCSAAGVGGGALGALLGAAGALVRRRRR